MCNFENKPELKSRKLGYRWQLEKLRSFEVPTESSYHVSYLHEAFGFLAQGRAVAHVGSQRIARAQMTKLKVPQNLLGDGSLSNTSRRAASQEMLKERSYCKAKQTNARRGPFPHRAGP